MHLNAPTLHRIFVGLCLLLAGSPASATAAPGDDEVVQVQRTWWAAYTQGNIVALEATTSGPALATFSNGVTITRQELMQMASQNGTNPGFSMKWSDDVVQRPRDDLALVIATSTEQAGSNLQRFRISTLLQRTPRGKWEVLGVQSTRIAAFTARVPTSAAGKLDDFVGMYLTPKGRHLRIEVHEGVLSLVEPEGKVIELAAIGPGLFESTGRSPINGVLRFAFSRDDEGRVASFSRLTEGKVDTYSRVE